MPPRDYVAAERLGPDAGKDDASRNHLKRLQGDWRRVTRSVNGVQESVGRGDTVCLTFTENQMSSWYADTGRKQELEYWIVLDATREPAAMDIIDPHFRRFVGKRPGPGNSDTGLAIYKIDGDRLTICGGLAGDPRPRAFGFPGFDVPASSYMLEVFQRVKE
jgi:uncharacterized protein (TIGR03067 family)